MVMRADTMSASLANEQQTSGLVSALWKQDVHAVYFRYLPLVADYHQVTPWDHLLFVVARTDVAVSHAAKLPSSLPEPRG